MIKQISILSVSALVATSCGIFTGKDKNELRSSDGQKTIDLSYMDKSVKASEDFFTYANGTWVKNNPVPASESRWGSFNELDQENKKKLKAILDDAVKANAPEGDIQQLLGAYYASYINMDQRNKNALGPVEELIYNITEMKTKDELPAILAQLHNKGISAFFNFGVGQDLKKVDEHVLYLSQGGIGLPNRNYYLDKDKESILSDYKGYITNLIGITGLRDRDNFAGAVVAWEQNMSASMMEPKELRIPENTYNPTDFAEVAQYFQNFDFRLYTHTRGFGDIETPIIVGQPGFFETLGNQITDAPFEQIKMYMKWCVLNHYAPHLSQDFVDASFNFYGKTIKGSQEMKPIEERAINEITDIAIGEALGKAFVERHFSEAAKERVNKMVDNLLIVFEERINNLDWMSAETKQQAQLKLASIGRKLGFPEEWKDFSGLKLSKDNYIANVDACTEFSIKENMAKLNKPVDKKEWGMPAHMVNAYYHPLLNEIAFPAGIMQPPFFDMEAEDAVNYGTIGMVIGHEFTHGFDDMGSKFAADGSFTNWWSEADRSAFEKRTEKLGNTFEQFCAIEGHCVNPDLTMGENIADLGGITMAYHAYTRTEEFKEGEEIKGFTPAQRFFIAYAQLWKINYTEAELKNRLENDPHSPGMYRVNGPLMNCPEFFEAFQVAEGDAMRNSADKISKIW
ncbi:endothelin-converting enzyme Metallo peptidase. MEROPS family M13 [Lishizhenia tianjinensis]|uniref:Endothelin-converting enzyme Metallo peptidase. MEROPS family M13 n=1 Tax=Lishizhenia tianjinensis TaxID=477690 RepID=A0A1I6X8J2_9FLAO|nr:M13 family metallopeptidase [Lishizhenia tianjinensis]SFT34668.1 endothelin-converting enzyme Metallo peptidase. MEROPS family M13 [Lishizhenia tianjinensis]